MVTRLFAPRPKLLKSLDFIAPKKIFGRCADEKACRLCLRRRKKHKRGIDQAFDCGQRPCCPCLKQSRFSRAGGFITPQSPRRQKNAINRLALQAPLRGRRLAFHAKCVFSPIFLSLPDVITRLSVVVELGHRRKY